MHLYRIEHIKLQPLLVLAQNHDDAANILGFAFMTGLRNRPDANFDVVYLKHKDLMRAPPKEWIKAGYRGIAWSVDEDRAWEFHHTKMIMPDSS